MTNFKPISCHWKNEKLSVNANVIDNATMYKMIVGSLIYLIMRTDLNYTPRGLER